MQLRPLLLPLLLLLLHAPPCCDGTNTSASNIRCCPSNCNWPYGECVLTAPQHLCYRECRCLPEWSGIDCTINVHAQAPLPDKPQPPFLAQATDFTMTIGWERKSTSYRYPLFNSYVLMAYDPGYSVPYYPAGHPMRKFAAENGWVKDYVPGEKGYSDADVDRSFQHIDMGLITKASGAHPPRIGEFGYRGEPGLPGYLGDANNASAAGNGVVEARQAALLELENESDALELENERNAAMMELESGSDLPVTSPHPKAAQVPTMAGNPAHTSTQTNMSALVWHKVYSGANLSFGFSNVWPDVAYWFRIGHINAGGEGPPSDPVSYKTTGTTLNCVAGHACYKPPHDYPTIINGCLNMRAKSAALRNMIMRKLKDPDTGITQDPLAQATGELTEDLGQYPWFGTVLNITNVQDPATNITYTFSIDILDFCAGVDGVCNPDRAAEPYEKLWPPEAIGWSSSKMARAHAWVDKPFTQWTKGQFPTERYAPDRPTYALPWAAPKNCSSGNHWCKWSPFPVEVIYRRELVTWQSHAFTSMHQQAAKA